MFLLLLMAIKASMIAIFINMAATYILPLIKNSINPPSIVKESINQVIKGRKKLVPNSITIATITLLSVILCNLFSSYSLVESV